MNRQLAPGHYCVADLRAGDWIDCGSGQIAADAIADFADISGDRFEIHLDDAGARAVGLERQVAHGLLVVARTEGLVRRAPAQIVEAELGRWDWRFRQPVLAGDKIAVLCTLSESAQPAPGSCRELGMTVEARNQDGIVVLTGETRLNTEL